MRIQLLCDQKWRDLPNISALKLLLEQRGHRVLVTTTKDAAPLMQIFRPDCVVFNHLFGTYYAELSTSLKRAGIAVVMLPTEGAMFPAFVNIAAGEFADFSACELILNWSEPAAALVRERWNLDAAQAPVVGCTRFDFYTPRYRSAVTTREAFCHQHGLDASKPIVTWATQYGYAPMASDETLMQKFLREATDVGVAACLERVGIKLSDYPRIHAESRELASNAFFSLAADRPDIQFVLRPHPAEGRDYYRKRISDGGHVNIRFCPEDYIWNILAASDLHLHRHCTTAVEAWLWGKPTIEMALDTGGLQWPEREKGSRVISNLEELRSATDDLLSGKQISEEISGFRSEYIELWFGNQDGQRCVAAADAIDAHLKRRGTRRTYVQGISLGKISCRQTLNAAIRHVRSRTPNMRSFGASSRPASDEKQISRYDVENYSRMIEVSVLGADSAR